MENKLTQDVDGNESSKRHLGIRAMNIAFAIAIIYFLAGIGMAIFEKEFVYKFPFDMWVSILGIGASLLGITLVERFGKK